MLKKILLASMFAITAIANIARAESDLKTVASKAYVDTKIETKQLKIPAANTPGVGAGETVMTYTATGNGTIGERGLYSDISSYDASTDGDKLITASALNDTFTNLPTTDTTKLECANQNDGCTLWTIVDQTAYCNMIVSPNLVNLDGTKIITVAGATSISRPAYAGPNLGNAAWTTIGNNVNFGAILSGFITPCNIGDKYTIKYFGNTPTSSNKRFYYAEYNSEGKVTKARVPWVNGNTITAENNGFLAIQWLYDGEGQVDEMAKALKIMVVKGDIEPTEYHPYGQTCIDQTNAHGKNLFDKTTATPGAIIASTGAQGTNPNYYGSDYIPVTAGAQYYLSGNDFATGNVGAWYKADKTYLSGINANGLLTAPTGAYYIRFSMGAAAIDTTQLELGSTATPYEPYN